MGEIRTEGDITTLCPDSLIMMSKMEDFDIGY